MVLQSSLEWQRQIEVLELMNDVDGALSARSRMILKDVSKQMDEHAVTSALSHAFATESASSQTPPALTNHQGVRWAWQCTSYELRCLLLCILKMVDTVEAL